MTFRVMNLKLTEAIVRNYGKFLEISHSGLIGLFLTEIPESLLPYPKEKIEKALVIAEKHFSLRGDKETARWKVCSVKAYEWDGSFFSYSEELSRIILKLKCED